MLEARAICETCGHTRDWHDRDAERARLGSDPPVERPCYREVGGAPCRCGGFRESGTFAMPLGFAATRGSAPGFAMVRVAALALLLVVMGLGLLYAYRSQTPSVPEVDLSQATRDIGAGRVRTVTIASNKATIEFKDSPTHKEQTTLAEPDTILAPAVSEYNAAHPSQAIELRHLQDGQTVGLASILPSLLAILVIGLFFYYVAMRRRAS